MRFIVFVLLWISKISTTYPRLIIAAFVAVSVAGFACMPFIKLSTNILAGVGHDNTTINLTVENGTIFGEQDSLIVVLEFPEPPGESRLQFIRGLSDAISQLPDVRRVRYRLLDPEDHEQTASLFRNFLASMDKGEQEEIHRILSPDGVKSALRRTRNRLFLADNPYIQEKLLEDPLEVSQFVSRAMERRMGSVYLGDLFLLIASPDSTLFLIQVTPDFTSSDLVRGTTLVNRMRQMIPEKIVDLTKTIPAMKNVAAELKWRLTGKTVFQYESDVIFDQETTTIVGCSFLLVMFLVLAVYRSFWSAVILMTPLGLGIGPNYGVIYLSYHEVNPVVMGATGVLLGLGAEYGEHLWGRIREELDRGRSRTEALRKSYAETGPPVLLGGFTGILAFLCMCLSSQPALAQFGYFGAIGLLLTMLSTLFLLPAIFTVVASREKDYFPRVKFNCGVFSRISEAYPRTIIGISAVVLLISLVFVTRVSYEKDLFKVFLAKNMESMSVSQNISRKFHSNFSQPTLLSFDVEDVQSGLCIQRSLDGILQRLMETDHEIASFDSVSYLMAPDAVRDANVRDLADIVASWPKLEESFTDWAKSSDLAARSVKTMGQAFTETGKILKELGSPDPAGENRTTHLERSWYMTKFEGKYRFLTRIRYADSIADPEQLKHADRKILEAVKTLPVPVSISGARQAMEAILSTLVADLVKLGFYGFISVVVVFFLIFPSPIGVGLCLIPMLGAFSVTLGVVGAFGLGVPFSIVCVAPLIFGFGIHNGMHVVMGSLVEKGGSVARTVDRVTPRALVTSSTITMGFVSMLTSQHYPMVFLGGTMVIGMAAAVPLTLATLPAILVLIERRRNQRALAEGQS
jgi:uncharacterized protein